MKAVCWYGPGKLKVERVPDPEILTPTDAIVEVSAAAVCGSDLHLYDGWIPSVMKGDILGHEVVGTVVEVGKEVRNLHVGERVVVPFPISCGHCWYCQQGLWSLCDNSNPNAWMAEKLWGYSPAGIYGYSHLLGGYAGGQAEYMRVPFADVGPLVLPDTLSSEAAVMLADVFPTGYMGAEFANIQGGDVVAVFGCGPVGQFAIRSAFMLGAERVIAIDRFPERLRMAHESGAEVVNYENVEIIEALREMTGGRGPDSCIEAVGMEAHDMGFEGAVDRVKQAVRMETGRPHALRAAIVSVRKGGTVALSGVFGGLVDSIPMGAFVNKALTMRSGQTHVHRYLRPLLRRIEAGEIDPSFVVTHRMSLDDAPKAYEIFKHKEDECIKCVLNPHG
jgi:threonine dehydrogenase-like Zn-dependent dehydrogenase